MVLRIWLTATSSKCSTCGACDAAALVVLDVGAEHAALVPTAAHGPDVDAEVVGELAGQGLASRGRWSCWPGGQHGAGWQVPASVRG